MLGIEGLEIIPEHCRESVHNYIVQGTPMDGFLTYIFSNDFVHALGNADTINRRHLFDYAMFLYCHAPSECWGSEGKVKKWVGRRGLSGDNH